MAKKKQKSSASGASSPSHSGVAKAEAALGAPAQQVGDPARTIGIAAAVLVGGFIVLNMLRGGGIGVDASAPSADIGTISVAENVKRKPLTQDESDVVGQYLHARFYDDDKAVTLPASLTTTPGAVYIAARENGDRVYWVWRKGDTTKAAIDDAIDDLLRSLGDKKSRVTTLEVNLAHTFRVTDPKRDRRRITNVYRGLRGIEIIKGGKVQRYAPTEMLALNIDFTKALERFAQKEGTTMRTLESGDATIRTFEADQMIVELTSPPVTTLMVRGNVLVDIKEITKPAVVSLAQAHGDFLFNNLQPDGRMLYKYWPSRGEESGGNNMIRQWMATVAMGRVARREGDAAKQERVAQNIRYNLAQFYGDDNGHGMIIEHVSGGAVKLGAVALAALAIVEHPNRAEWATFEKGLLKTIDALWDDDGSFKTFYRPSNRGRHDNANFYPGEALLLWGTLYEQTSDPSLLDRIMRSLRFYKGWHLENRNPAFIPWHTQAYYKVFEKHKGTPVADEVKDWVFEMNDWLLGVQQWDDQKDFPDTMGRFHDPKRPFGPPHSSSTGVYLEGLIDAWRMAKAVGDAARQENYRTAIMRGLRSVTQLTFLDDIDMFYIKKRDIVRGGVRTTVYDNEVRVDNIQHNLMGIQKILDYMGEEEFRP
jgi:hypothetical protein